MLGNTLTFNIGGTNITLVRRRDDGGNSEYVLRTAFEEYRAYVRHSSRIDKSHGGVRVDRHNMEFVQDIFPTTAHPGGLIRRAYFVFENCVGDTIVDPPLNTAALFGLATASSNALLTQLIQGEA
jgi:hypothetical protein